MVEKPPVEGNETTSKGLEMSAGAALAKGLIVAAPASVLPDRFPNHPHESFAIAMLAGFLVQNLVPPRRRFFLPLLALTVVIIMLNLLFVK